MAHSELVTTISFLSLVFCLFIANLGLPLHQKMRRNENFPAAFWTLRAVGLNSSQGGRALVLVSWNCRIVPSVAYFLFRFLSTGCVYMAGVLAGSLGTSVFDPDVYLVGASGGKLSPQCLHFSSSLLIITACLHESLFSCLSVGVYALLAAHLANVLLNYNNMEFGLVRLLGVFLIGKPSRPHLREHRSFPSPSHGFQEDPDVILLLLFYSECGRGIRHL